MTKQVASISSEIELFAEFLTLEWPTSFLMGADQAVLTIKEKLSAQSLDSLTLEGLIELGSLKVGEKTDNEDSSEFFARLKLLIDKAATAASMRAKQLKEAEALVR